ncbi:MAG: hypothetical protein KJN72_12220 [Woeseia sp.]|nr:hypothetical protein [Woeseia sp.]
MIVLDWFLRAELNRSRIEVQEGTAAVGEAWMDLITRVTITTAGVTVDSDNYASAFDWTTEKASSIIRLELGKTDKVLSDFTIAGNPFDAQPARIDFYHGTDNAVLSHNSQYGGGVRFRIYSE